MIGLCGGGNLLAGRHKSIKKGQALLVCEDISVHVARKAMKNLRLRVLPPHGEVHLSAPHHVSTQAIQRFVRGQLAWIRKKQAEIAARPVLSEEMVNGERHRLFGQEYELRLCEKYGRHQITIADGGILLLTVRPGTTIANRRRVLSGWYRQQLSLHLLPLIEQWQATIGVTVQACTIRQMRTRWGSCNITKGRISINLELARRPPGCLEYVLVHEMVHLLEPSHNERFWGLVGHYLPDWQEHRAALESGLFPCRPSEEQAWCVYMVRCADNTLYTGITNNLTQRLAAHNSAKGGAKYTRPRQPVSLVYVEEGLSHSLAAKREYVIKKMATKQKRQLVTL